MFNNNNKILIKRYTNYFLFNFFLNLKIKNGNSKSFKKKFIYTYYSHIILNNLNITTLNNFFKLFILNKKYSICFIQNTRLTYLNHKKKYISNIIYSVLDKKKRKYFFIKFLKFFFYPDRKKTICNLILNLDNNLIYKTYNRLHYLLIFRYLKA